MIRTVICLALMCSLVACKSDWKVHGGPPTCQKMCEHWGLQFAAMVGVGNQDASGEGATACVCVPAVQPPAAQPATPGGAAAATSLAAPIVIAAAQAAAVAARQQQMRQQQQRR